MQLRSPKNIYEGDRPREKMKVKGAANLSDLELLMVIIGSGVKGHNVAKLASEVLEKMKDRKMKLNLDDLLVLPGINTAKACAILSALELARRQNIFAMQSIKKPADILPLVMKYGSKKQEHLVCFSLNGAGGVIEERVVSIGILNSTLIHPREVFADALSDRAASIILVHNHPSGIVEASSEDRELTKKLVEAGKILGIPLLDHIIITKEGKYFSFQENNSLDTSF